MLKSIPTIIRVYPIGTSSYSKFIRKEVIAIDEVRNSKMKRICDVSKDRRLIIINIGDCPVKITANADGTFNIEGATIIREAA